MTYTRITWMLTIFFVLLSGAAAQFDLFSFSLAAFGCAVISGCTFGALAERESMK